MECCSGIITKGLGLDACKGMIINHFSLGLDICVKPVVKTGGGGPYPYPAWNKLSPGQAQQFFTPVNLEQLYQEIPDYTNLKDYVKITVTFNSDPEHPFEKEYILHKNKAKPIVKILNILNKTKQMVMVQVYNIKQLYHTIMVKVKNIYRIK